MDELSRSFWLHTANAARQYKNHTPMLPANRAASENTDNNSNRFNINVKNVRESTSDVLLQTLAVS